MSEPKTDQVKPGIGCHTEHPPGANLKDALRFSGARPAQGLRPVDPDSKRTPWFGLRLSKDLRDALESRAASERTSASCYVRTLLADHLAVEGTPDRVDGRRFVDADVEAASLFMADVGKMIVAARELPDSARRDGVLTLLESAHGKIVRIIEKADAVERAGRRAHALTHASHEVAP